MLVLTDHSLSGEVLAEQVRSLGHACRVAKGCPAALEALQIAEGQENWTCILTDQTFAGPNCPAITTHLKEMSHDKRPMIIVLNNISSLQKDEHLADLGISGTLSKPVRLSQLAGALSGHQTSAPDLPTTTAEPTEKIDLDNNPDQGPSILLAEDNPFNQKVAMAMLRMLGCRVQVATTGVEAVDLARRNDYDLIFMDCQMPVMDGYEATRRIRQLPDGAGNVNIVAMTANALSGDRKACFAVGMNDFLSKPITKDMLRDMLEKWEVLTEKIEVLQP